MYMYIYFYQCFSLLQAKITYEVRKTNAVITNRVEAGIYILLKIQVIPKCGQAWESWTLQTSLKLANPSLSSGKTELSCRIDISQT